MSSSFDGLGKLALLLHTDFCEYEKQTNSAQLTTSEALGTAAELYIGAGTCDSSGQNHSRL